MLFKKGSEGEEQAFQYLECHIPEQDVEKFDLNPLKESFFDVPDVDTLAEGSYEFEGKYGLKVSFDLVDWSDSHCAFGECWPLYGNSDSFEGKIKPIFEVKNLKISTPNFSYDLNGHARRTSIKWMPGLKTVDSELSRNYVHIEGRKIYMIDLDGFFSRPVDLLGYFHELGHRETRSPDDMCKEKNTVMERYSSSKGFETEYNKSAAYELQRERDSNAWMIRKLSKLFADIGISKRELVDYVNRCQLKSYNDLYRRVILEKVAEEEEDVA